MKHPFFTIGHSTRSVGEFVDLLRPQKIDLVVDVRSIPRSRTNPQYNSEKFAKALAKLQINYVHMPTLGGLRGRTCEVAPEVNAFWENRGFHNYADYAMGEEFRSGLARLREMGHANTSVIMCAEAVWWRCHRRIIADYLIAANETVFHILGPNRIEQARITQGVQLGAAGVLRYPVAIAHFEQKKCI